MIYIPPELRGSLAGVSFIDLFAGIGGFRYAMDSFGANCVFTSEWNVACQETYKTNHGGDVNGDITKVMTEDVPAHDVLCGGFPCQAFSICGNQKGFAEVRGTLFYDIVRIANHHKPKMLLLENVKNLASHDDKRTLKVIRYQFESCGYDVFDKVLSASDFGVPHARERIFIIGIRKDLDIKFVFPTPTPAPISLLDVTLDDSLTAKYVINTTNLNLVINTKDVEPALRPIRIGKINLGRQGERIYHPSGHAITLSSGGGGMGAKTGLYLINGKVRRLAPGECLRLMGLPESFKMHKSDTQCYKQFGNGVVVDVLQHLIMSAIQSGVFSKAVQSAADGSRETLEIEWPEAV